MPLNHKLKVLFIHIPKTGGTSIIQMLDMTTQSQMNYSGNIKRYPIIHKAYLPFFSTGEYSNLLTRPPQHFTLKELKRILGNSVDDYYKFSVVRNPYARIASEYTKLLGKKAGLPDYESFGSFVNIFLSKSEYERNLIFQGHLETQTSYLIKEDGVIDPSVQIFKLENFNECIAKIQELNPGVPVRHSNSSPSYDYTSLYTPEIAAKVYEFYKVDFENFGYSATM